MSAFISVLCGCAFCLCGRLLRCDICDSFAFLCGLSRIVVLIASPSLCRCVLPVHVVSVWLAVTKLHACSALKACLTHFGPMHKRLLICTLLWAEHLEILNLHFFCFQPLNRNVSHHTLTCKQYFLIFWIFHFQVKGPGTLRVHLLDKLYSLTVEDIIQNAKVTREKIWSLNQIKSYKTSTTAAMRPIIFLFVANGANFFILTCAFEIIRVETLEWVPEKIESCT